MNPHKRLFSPDAAVTVRDGITATDAGTWVPTSDDEILDAREWQHVHVFPEFVGGTGTNFTLTPLIRVRQEDGSYAWLERASTGVIVNVSEGVEVDSEGHFMSFRVTGLTLGGATSVRIRVTGGVKRENLAGG